MKRSVKIWPTQEEIRARLIYDPDTGIFTWKEGTFNRRRYGDGPCGTDRLGYVFIGFGKLHQLGAHKLAWIYMNGTVPDGLEVDHKDNIPDHNWIDNLRLATSQQQKQNRKVQTNNRSGLKGAYYHACHKGKKWRSQIKLSPGRGTAEKLKFLGYFHTAQEAHEAYKAAALVYFGEFARAN